MTSLLGNLANSVKDNEDKEVKAPPKSRRDAFEEKEVTTQANVFAEGTGTTDPARPAPTNDLFSNDADGDLGDMEQDGGEVTDEQPIMRTPEPIPTPTPTPTPQKQAVQEAERVIRTAPVKEESSEKSIKLNNLATPTGATGSQDVTTSTAYSEAIEGFVTTACQLNNVRNVDLATYGLMAVNASYNNLDVLTFGDHKFLGVPYTEKEESLILVKLATFIDQSNEVRNVIRAVQKLNNSSVESYTLLYTEEMIQRFVDTFGYTVQVNYTSPTVSDLCIVVEKVS